MCSTEEDSALLHRSREAELVESGAEVESVVESVVREGGEVIVDGDKREGGEATDGGISAGHGFGEKDSSGDEGPGPSDGGSCVETGSYHSTCSEERHDLDYLARKKGTLFLGIDRWPAFSRLLLNAFFFIYFL